MVGLSEARKGRVGSWISCAITRRWNDDSRSLGLFVERRENLVDKVGSLPRLKLRLGLSHEGCMKLQQLCIYIDLPHPYPTSSTSIDTDAAKGPKYNIFKSFFLHNLTNTPILRMPSKEVQQRRQRLPNQHKTNPENTIPHNPSIMPLHPSPLTPSRHFDQW